MEAVIRGRSAGVVLLQITPVFELENVERSVFLALGLSSVKRETFRVEVFRFLPI